MREAMVLPLLLLGVAAGGGFRSGVIDGAWRFLPPAPMTLVLGLLLVGVLVRTGVLAPRALLGPHRTSLANANGAVLLGLLPVASAQVFTALSPESGLLQVLASVFFLLLLVNTLAAQPSRARAMQSLGVVLLSAFVLKYVVLDALYAPEGSLARRVVTTMLEGVSLGALGYTSHGTATAYVAFVVVLAYLFALVLLPGDETNDALEGRAGSPNPASPSAALGERALPLQAALGERALPLQAALGERALPTTIVTTASVERPAPPDPDDR